METQYESACRGRVTSDMEVAGRVEGVSGELVRKELAAGRAVLPSNSAHPRRVPCVIGRAFQTKINANLGFSPDRSCLEDECEKLDLALSLGADCIMDLSVGGDLAAVRNTFLDRAPVPFGTVPVYEALARLEGDITHLTADLLLSVIAEQAEQGVDFMTLHAGLLRCHIPQAVRRRLGIVSRGGAILARWMSRFEQENPLYTAWDDILAICRAHDVTVSLGDGLRPGCLADAGDASQYAELDTLGELVKRCRAGGVQVMVEGPGHVPLNAIAEQMERQRQVCDDAPFYVLGPIVTDIAPGYDHLSAAIGATQAAWHGASLLCYVTPAEHLGLPDRDDVRQGVVAFKLAAHAADVARGFPGARDRDDAMADARGAFDWSKQFSLALDGETARRRFESGSDVANPAGNEFCSMCGKDFCAVRNSRAAREESAHDG